MRRFVISLLFCVIFALFSFVSVFAQMQQQEAAGIVSEEEQPAAEDPPVTTLTVPGTEQSKVPSASGFTAKVEISTNLVQFYNQDIRNDTFIEEAEMPREESVYFLRNPNYDDLDFNVAYNDPEGRFGAQINFAFGALLETHFTTGDIFGWAKISPYFRGKLGKFTERVVEKIGGDKDLGVMLFEISNSDLVINTSDSLGLGSDIIGFIPTGYLPLGNFGELAVSGFLAPNEYYLGRKINNAADQSGSTMPTIVPAYATYKFGGSLKYTFPDWGTLGAAYRTYHTIAGEGVELGNVFHDYGFYAIVTLPMLTGLKIGLGYSGHLDYREEIDRDDEIYAPIQNAIHLDVTYQNVIPGLSLGLYNNLSFYTLAKEDTIGYLVTASSLFEDVKSTVWYNELSASYMITKALTATLMVRNYYAELLNYQGVRGKNYGKEVFIVEALARYNITEKVQVRGGLKFEMTKYNTPLLSLVMKNDNNAFSIPIGIIVSW